MAGSDRPDQDHDQRLKVLLKEFFEAFFRCFFADMADWFEFGEVEWLDKEVFTAPPQGERRVLDLIARLRGCERIGEKRRRAKCEAVRPLTEYQFASIRSFLSALRL
ncbi:MAG: hypothetical protein ACYC61_32210 [Isosphaeraceae bacterium]